MKLSMISAKDLPRVMLSFLYFFCLMAAYFILRPVRDEMGIQAGVQNMQWLFTGTFFAMILVIPLFGWLTKTFKRDIFIPVNYALFLVQILAFYWLFEQKISPQYTAIAFYIWLSVFNLFVVSVFWSFMSDIFDFDHAKEHFAVIAAGGTVGAITGPSLSALLATTVGTTNLLLIAGGFLFVTILITIELAKKTRTIGAREYLDHPIKNNIWSGVTSVMNSPKLMGIAAFVLLYTCMSTFLYFEQAHIVSAEITNSDQRTTYFALRDIGSNVLTLLLQFFITRKILKQYGLIVGLCVIPVVTMVIFISLGFHPGLYVLAIGQILYRGGNFAIQKPSREILFTQVNYEERYRAKNFIDTTVYRGGDAISGWLFSGLSSLGLSLSGIALVGVPLAFLWFLTGRSLGKTEKIAPVVSQPIQA